MTFSKIEKGVNCFVKFAAAMSFTQFLNSVNFVFLVSAIIFVAIDIMRNEYM